MGKKWPWASKTGELLAQTGQAGIHFFFSPVTEHESIMGYLFISINKTAFVMYTTGEAEFFFGWGGSVKIF